MCPKAHFFFLYFFKYIKERGTENVIYSSERIILVATTAADFGLKALFPRIAKHKDVDSLDFIELGRSNFDTVSHAAQSLLASEQLSDVRGIAVEVVSQYLAALPVIEGVQKINAGIVTAEEDQMVSLYFLPETIVDKVSHCRY